MSTATMHSAPSEWDVVELRQEVVRLRAAARAADVRTQRIEQVVAAMADAHDEAAAILVLVEAFRAVLGFEQAWLMVRREDGYEVAISSRRSMLGAKWPADGFIDRLLAGEIVVSHDIGGMDFWMDRPAMVREGVRSAFHCGATGPSRAIVLVGTHRLPGLFGPEAVAQVAPLRPLLAQLPLGDVCDPARQAALQASWQAQTEASVARMGTLVDALLAHLQAAVVVEDEDRRIVLVNQEYCDLFGYAGPPESLRGEDAVSGAVALSTRFANPTGHLLGVQRLLAARSRVLGEELQLADGRVLERDYVPVFVGGEYRGHLWQFHDVSKRREIEARLVHDKEEAESASEAKSDFLASMSHEIRTPLNAIIGMTELMLDTRLDSEQDEMLHTIQTNSEALLGLLSDVLDFSRIEAGRIALDAVPFSPRVIAEDVACVLAMRAAAKSLQLMLSVDPAMPPRGVGDPGRLRQVLTNLVTNAIKYTDSGEVTIEVERSARYEPGLCLRVSDTGVGISEEDQERIFDKFVQALGHQRSVRGGVGLGLHITRALVEMMGGQLSLDSELGRGSRFQVDVPMPPHEAGDDKVSALARMVDGRLVLVVDSHPFTRAAASAQLGSLGVRVHAVPNTAEAAQWLRQTVRCPDVVIIDDRVGRADARSLAQRCRAAFGDKVRLARIEQPGRPSKPGHFDVVVHHPLRLDSVARALVPKPPWASATLRPAAVGGGTAARRLLVVEDNPDNQRVLKSHLESLGNSVDVAKDGIEGFEAIGRVSYDLVLMDIHMPNLDGFGCVARVRQREKADGRARTPIIAVTAHATAAVRSRCAREGFDGFLAKPVTRERLSRVVAEHARPPFRVLVADDAPEARRLLERYMDALDGVEVVSVGDGQEAVDAFGPDLDLVILDVQMPRLNGLEAARAIRQQPGGDLVSLVALTGEVGPEARQKCLDAGFDEHMVKPVRRKALLESVRRHLETRRERIAVDPSRGFAGPSEDLASTLQDLRRSLDTGDFDSFEESSAYEELEIEIDLDGFDAADQPQAQPVQAPAPSSTPVSMPMRPTPAPAPEPAPVAAEPVIIEVDPGHHGPGPAVHGRLRAGHGEAARLRRDGRLRRDQEPRPQGPGQLGCIRPSTPCPRWPVSSSARPWTRTSPAWSRCARP